MSTFTGRLGRVASRLAAFQLAGVEGGFQTYYAALTATLFLSGSLVAGFIHACVWKLAARGVMMMAAARATAWKVASRVTKCAVAVRDFIWKIGHG